MARTEGERRFEKYLQGMGYPYDYEKEYSDKSKRPDYTVTKDGTFLFDVKDFRSRVRSGAFQYEPYTPIRRRIQAGKRQFKEYKEFPCCVVLQNNGDVHADIENPAIVFSAMYGNFGYEIPVWVGGGGPKNPPTTEIIFGSDAEMHRGKNTTISALITLRRVLVGQGRLVRVMREQRGLSISEAIGVARDRFGEQFDPGEVQQGVIVWENVYAKLPLPRQLFNGPFDERYGYDGSALVNLYYGSGLEQLDSPQQK